MKKFGIDISRWQGDFNFDKAIAEGVEFVIVKGGGGDDGLYEDRKFESNYATAKKKKLDVGCYFFSRALSVDEAIKEADYFYNNCLKGKQFELPIYMDVEHKKMLALGKDKLTAIVKAFCERLEAKGYWVGIYSSKSYFSSYMNDNELQGYAHWVAQWTKTCSYPYKESLGMWQFGGETNKIRTNKVAGVVCDQNYMLIDYPTLIKKAGKNGFKAEQVENKQETEKPADKKPADKKPADKKPAVKVEKTVDQLAKEVLDGKHGNGEDRKKSLGNRYNEVQKRVNEILEEQKQNNEKKEPAKGAAIKLNNANLYAYSTAKTPIKKISGTYYLYDGININGKYRITNKQSRCGKTPVASNVTGYIEL